MVRAAFVVVFAVCFALFPSGAAGAVFYVDAAATGANNGTSWTDAFTTIQAGVDAAQAAGGGEVWVKAGTYSGFTSDPVSDSFEALNPNAVDVIGEEKGMDYTAGGVPRGCHLTILYLTGDITVSQSVTFGSTTPQDSFTTRLLALVSQYSNVLVIVNHPSFVWGGSDLSITKEDLAAAANANVLHAMELTDVTKWDYVLANLDDQAGGCHKIMWGLFSDDSHRASFSDYRTTGAMMGSIPTAAQDPVYSDRRTALKDMIRRGSMVILPPNCKCGIPTYTLESLNGSASRMQVSLYVDNIWGATSAWMQFYGCDWATGNTPGKILLTTSLTLNANNSVSYYLTQTGYAGGPALTAEQKANIKYIRPILVWKIGSHGRIAYLQPVRIKSDGTWWDGPDYTLAGHHATIGPSPYPVGGTDTGEIVYFNTHAHSLASDGYAAPPTTRDVYWTNYGGLDPSKPRFGVLTDHNVSPPFTPPIRSVVVLKEGAHVYGGFAGAETSRDQRNWTANPTIIDGQNSGRCVYADGSSWSDDTDATLDGFTLKRGKAINGCGAGMWNRQCSPLVSNCTFTNNKASWGAGMSNSGSPSVSNCGFSNNSAEAFSGISYAGYAGGGMLIEMYGWPVVTNCQFSSNSARKGGAMFNSWLSPTVTNNIIAFNTASYCGGIFSNGGTPVLSHNDVYGNGTNYSGIGPGTGDISADPLFVNASGGDYHLSVASPCINAGTNSAPGLPPYDMDGQPRINNITVDIGPDEFQFYYVAQDAKKKANGESFTCSTMIISAAFEGFFYIEADDLWFGIRVDKAGHGLAVGMRADVTGTIRTNADGERYVDATTVVPNGTGSVAPLCLPNLSVGGGDWFYNPLTGAGQKGIAGASGLNNIGLLVRTWGKFTKTSDTTFTLNDGSGVYVKCVVPAGITLNPNWDYVIVTGISSCFKDGGSLRRLIRVRDGNDIQPLG